MTVSASFYCSAKTLIKISVGKEMVYFVFWVTSMKKIRAGAEGRYLSRKVMATQRNAIMKNKKQTKKKMKAEQAMGSKPVSSAPPGLCISSCLRVPAYLQVL